MKPLLCEPWMITAGVRNMVAGQCNIDRELDIQEWLYIHWTDLGERERVAVLFILEGVERYDGFRNKLKERKVV